MVPQQRAEMYLPKLSCRPEGGTAVTSCFKNNVCAAGASLCTAQRGDRIRTWPSRTQKSQRTPLCLWSHIQGEGKDTHLPQEKREGKVRLKSTPNHALRNHTPSATTCVCLQVCTCAWHVRHRSNLNNPNARKEKDEFSIRKRYRITSSLGLSDGKSQPKGNAHLNNKPLQ